MVKPAEYSQIRSRIKPGDLIACSGRGFLCWLIKIATHSNITHTGVVLRTKLLIEDEPQEGEIVQMIEATTHRDRRGVSTIRLSAFIEGYNGRVWWLPLSSYARERTDWEKFYDYLLRQEGKPYSVTQAFKSWLDIFDRIPLLRNFSFNKEKNKRFFCSKIVAGAYKYGGTVDASINPAEVFPGQVVRFPIFQTIYFQLKGKLAKVR